jgi:hypothetical protein
MQDINSLDLVLAVLFAAALAATVILLARVRRLAGKLRRGEMMAVSLSVGFSGGSAVIRDQ